RGLTEWLRVPDGPPTLPGEADAAIRGVRPAEGFLRYLKFRFWLVLGIVDVGIILILIVLAFAAPVVAAILALPALVLLVVPDVVAWLLIHLKYDSTWYVLTDRAARLRRGIVVIDESTITYENVQDVTVTSGPLQRYFGIADVVIQTAGGVVTQGKHGAHTTPNQGVIEGVADAQALRDLIMQRVRASKSAGLGDEDPRAPQPGPAPLRGGEPARREALGLAREIAEVVRGMRADARA
ncbi:MAG: PH domain-containing protein, partial [Planctomycetota bacterium]|nr:PH domain-containing protein [Planctomycetota bacterium]